MALPITHRWIAVGDVVLRTQKRADANAPETTLAEIIDIAKQRFANDQHLRRYGKDDARLMWFSDITESGGYYWFLAQTGDRNVTDVTYLNFDTLKSREIKKKRNEGGHYTAHVAISKKPLSKTTGHLLLAEKVPGIYLGSLKDHLTWLGSDPSLQKSYLDTNGKTKIAQPVFEVRGYESGTIRDALRTGTLQDIEFVQMVERHEDGLDEESVVRESVHEARWVVKQKVTDTQAQSVFAKVRTYLPKFRKTTSDDAKVFVRIKTQEGQIRQTEIDPDVGNVLEQAFIRNEIVKDFDPPLTQRHSGLCQDMMQKMAAIAKELPQREKSDA